MYIKYINIMSGYLSDAYNWLMQTLTSTVSLPLVGSAPVWAILLVAYVAYFFWRHNYYSRLTGEIRGIVGDTYSGLRTVTSDFGRDAGSLFRPGTNVGGFDLNTIESLSTPTLVRNVLG